MFCNKNSVGTKITYVSTLISFLDDAFLLRFLRAAKFSQLRAQKTFENFWTVRTVPGKGVPEWFDDLNPDDETMQKCLDLG